MISVGSRDGRKGLEQRFSSNNRRDMDDTELEEGEACSLQEEEDETSIDPDVALSYLDEKLQNVLGHFKKDFEGVVSAENLGAKYGVYGSFLPAYRRSPVWSHSRTPPRVQNHNTPQSPSNFRVEGGHHNSLVQASVHPVKHGSSAHKPPSQNDQCRQTAKTHSMQPVEDSTPKSEVRDQRTLKVRIKVGSDNPSVIKNTEIYTGLGLDGSPSSSFGDRPMESEGLFHGLPSDDHESLARMLQLMTSSPLFGGYLLSPLPDHLIQLSERPKVLQDILTQTSSKTNQVNSVIGCPDYSLEDNKKFSSENNLKSLDKKGCFLEVKREGDDGNDFDFSVKEEDIDAVSCEKLVPSALRLPLLSNAYSTIGESMKDSMERKVCSDVAVKREPVGIVPIPVSYSDKQNVKANFAVVDNRVAEMMGGSRKVGDIKGEPATSSTSVPAVGSKFKKASKVGQKDPVKQKADESTSSEGGMGVPSRKGQSSTGDKKKLKKNQAHNLAAVKVAKDSANDNELEHSSTQQDLSKASDKYEEFFGDMNGQEADIMDSPDVPCGDRLKTSETAEKFTLAYGSTLRDRASSLDTSKGILSRAGFSRGSSQNAPLLDNGRPISDPAPGGGDTDDNWVCCDKCQKWRLLPPGSKVESLPEKWLCSMLTWLPDMNRCSISEEETTAAVRARYQLLVDPNSLRVPLGSLATATSSADNLMLPNDRKIVDKLGKTTKSSFQDYPNRNPSSTRKKQQSAKDKAFIEPKESPLGNEVGFQQLNKSSDTNTETNQHKKIDMHRSDCDSDGGHAKTSKIRSIREPDKEFHRSSKKSKTRSTQSVDDDRPTVHDQENEMTVVNSGYCMGTNIVGKGNTTNSESFPFRISNHYMDGDSLVTTVKSKSQAEALPDVGSAYVSKSDTGNIAPKKRKTDIFQDPSSSTPSSSKLISDGELGSRKKQRVSKSEGKESGGSKRSGKSEKRGKSTSRHSLDNTESLRKDSSRAQPVVATTSSSSKVSGSLKVKSKLQEVKGSPVESVSSSPLRISNAEKLITGSKILVEKDDAREADKLTAGSPKKCSTGDYEGGTDGYCSIRKDITETDTHHGSVEPSMIDRQYKSNGDLRQKNGLAQNSPSNAHYGLSTNGCISLDSGSGYPSEALPSDKFVNEVTGDEGHLNAKVPRSGKSSKGSSELVKDKNQMFKSISNKEKVKISKSYDSQRDYTPDADNAEKAALFTKQEPSIPKSKQDYDEKKSSKKFDVEKSEQLSKSTREKSRRLSSDDDKIEMSNSLQPQQGNGVIMSSLDAHANDLSKDPKLSKKADSQNGTHHISSKHPTYNGYRVKNQDAPSPLRRDSSSQAAANALKEATHLKHLADRMKGNGTPDCTGLYFEAALKFLHAASLLESGKTENVKQGEATQCMQIYSSTAKLCEFCAHEYERSKDMASAALAYKCMEVAFLRVIYSSHHCASRDRQELQTVLQMVPPGESPSSSASDIDNLNNSAIGDKAPQARSGDSPQLATNLVISARNRPNFSRLLSYAQDVNSAMEASRRSRSAFAAANASMNNGDPKDGLTYIKRALDFNFNDVEGLLRLVRLAKEATSPK